MHSRVLKGYLFFLSSSIIIILLAKISPVYFWGFGLLAFLIPFILLIHLLALLSFILKRNKYLLLSFVVLLIGYNHIKNSVGFGKVGYKDSSNPNKSLSIITHNLGGYSFDSESSSQYYEQMNFRKYDLICFQEFAKSNTDSTIQQVQKQANIEKYHFVFDGKRMTPKDFGLLTLSKYPIISSGKISFGSNSFNGVIFVDIKVLSDTIRVYNAHFKSYSLREAKSWNNFYHRIKNGIIERALRTDEVLDHISKCEYPVILVGDFNEHPYSYVYNKFLKLLNDAIFGSFYIMPSTNLKFPVRMDYIMLDKNIKVKEFGILEYILISDHLPVYARVQYLPN